MKTMQKLIKRFERVHPGFFAWLDPLESYSGYYRIIIYDKWAGSTQYIFKTCREFKEWTDGVVMD